MEEWKLLVFLLPRVDSTQWEAVEHHPGSGYHQHHETVVDLALVVDLGPALPLSSEEMLSSSFPSFREDGSIRLDDPADRLSPVR